MARATRYGGLYPFGCVALALAVGTCTVTRAGEPTAGGPQRDLAARLLQTAGVEGGLIVHLGCGDGRLTAALRTSDASLVHGLDADADKVRQARLYLRSLGVYGNVSVDRYDGARLPYADNLVNLLVAEDVGSVPMDELMRVLRPGGIVCLKEADGWSNRVKPWPDDIDQWTHYLHDATGNAVAHDAAVGPPRHVQWLGAPWHARQHDHLASLSAMVSANGRIFYIVDEGPIASIALPAQWSLIARDAFNGVRLWTRPIRSWETYLRRFRSGPTQLPRRLVAVGDRVYVTLGYDAPVSVLDAATGRTVKTFEHTEGAEEIVWDAGVLFLVLGEPRSLPAESGRGVQGPWAVTDRDAKRLMAVDAETGAVLWRHDGADAAELFPLTLAVADGRLFYQNTEYVLCLDAKTGRELWRHARPTDPVRPGWSSPTLVVYGDVVLCADRAAETKKPPANASRNSRAFWTFYRGGPGRLVALSADTGRELWHCDCAESFHAPVDVFGADGLVWTGQNQARWLGGELHWLKTTEDWYKEEPTLGRDPHSGEVKRRLMAGGAFTPTGHHRCYRNKATDRFMLLGRTGVEFIDFRTGDPLRHNWIRGTCQYGILPCNGLLYVTPHACACYIQSKLNGFWALAAQESRVKRRESRAAGRLERGPAYAAKDLQSPASGLQPSSWPTYRHDAARSGATPAPLSADLTLAWQAELGGRLCSAVVADGRVFVAQVDAHTVHALEAASGKSLWSFTVGGRVDSPPSVSRGRVVFGSADGSVYCLRAADGALAWRFRAAPEDRRIVAFGRLESAWPVPGSVLVQDDIVAFAAGRSSYLDGGMYLYRLDLQTGRCLSETRLDDRDPATGGQREDRVDGMELPGALPDVLSGDGEFFFLRDLVFDRNGVLQAKTVRHLYCPRGFLDDTWWHRTYWLYGSRFYSGAGGWPRAGREFPSGRILVFDDQTIYGFGRRPEYYRWTTSNEYHLFATRKDPQPSKPPPRGSGRRQAGRKWRPAWSETVSLHVRAMVLAGRTLFVAGPPDETDEGSPRTFMLQSPLAGRPGQTAQAAWQGRHGARLWAVSAADGRKQAEYELRAPPVWDGMAAAAGRLYLATTDGKVVCFASNKGVQ